MNNSIWWISSQYFGRAPRDVPHYYLVLGVKSDWLKQRDPELWRAFQAELKHRAR